MMVSRGLWPNWMAWPMSEKAPEIIAWEAITVATVARSDQRIQEPAGVGARL